MDASREGSPDARGTLGQSLRRARRRRFVGRSGELELFRGGLADAEDSFRVLFLHGPGGVGKTALLGAFEELATDAGATAVRLDTRNVQPSPAAVLDALCAVLGCDDGADGVLAAMARKHRPVLLLDTYEMIAPLDGWVREWLLPQLPGDVLVVIAGRTPPGPRWTADPAWRDLLRVVGVRNMRGDDVRAYLLVEGVPAGLHDRLAAVTHGHPLTLSMLVDVILRRGEDAVPSSLVDVPDILRAVLERVVEAVPSPRHRAALEVCAHARFTNEELLRVALGEPDVADLFDWLRAQGFIEENPRGLFPHDLIRDALDADLRWRDRARYAELHRRVRKHLLARVLDAGDEREQQRRVTDVIFMTRAHPLIGAYWHLSSLDDAYTDGLRPDDRRAVVDMTREHQGAEQARLAAYWMDRQPGAFRVFRVGGEPVGYAGYLALHEADPADVDRDPGARAMWAYAQRHGAPRPGEPVTAWRFFLDRVHYHDPSASRTLAAAWHVQEILSRGRSSWDFIGVYEHSDAWTPLFAYDFARASEADFTVGGHRYAVFAHDWRRLGLEDWLELGTRSELGAPAEPPTAAPPALVLAQPEFTAAVRDALRDLHADDRLADNPLLRSQLVIGDRSGRTGVESLRGLIREAADALRADPRDERLFHVVDRTFLRPAATQERAAEALHLSFSTYRRHRDRAVERIVAYLWRRELHGPPA
ncbi:MAG TPA: AAA family ATPase [Pilimelia sp.]|nr:AAA family ATPase [Pilimelia sp.]